MRGVRVLEIDSSIASGYCARLLASAGAEVICLEPPGGAALRRTGPWIGDGPVSALWEYLGAGKRSIALDDDDRVDALLAWADVVLSSANGGADAALARHERVAAANPAAVHTVVSGYGLTGPYRDWRRSELTDWAAGGHLFITGEPDREPLQGGGPWASYMTGATAAVGTIAALFDSSRDGRGQLVDVGAMEAMAGLHQWSLTMYTHLGYVKQRWGNRFGEWTHPIALYQCRDGWISIVTPSPHTWEALCVTMELWDLLVDTSLEIVGERFDRAAEIDAQINAWLSDRTVADAVHTLQAAGVPASPLLGMADVLADEQETFRQFWTPAPWLGPDAKMPARAVTLPGGVAPGPAPAIGQDEAEIMAELSAGVPAVARPNFDLACARVLELGVAWAGPLAGRFLGDLGLDVIKVEHPLSRGLPGDASKAEGWKWGTLPHPQVRSPIYPDGQPGTRWWNRSGLFNKMNRSKRGIALDAKSDTGAGILADLIRHSDLILNNFSPRGTKSLGIDADRVSELNPSAITIAMSGYGATGPLADNLSYGPVLQAHAGFDEATGYDETGPVRIGLAFPDAVAGVHAAFAALVALWDREVTGVAPHVDLSEFETLLSIGGDLLLAASVTGHSPARHANRSEDYWPQGVYRCLGDDQWITLTVTSDREWADLVELLANPALAGLRNATRDERRDHADRIDAALGLWAGQREAADAARDLQAAGIAALPALTSGDIVTNEQIRARGYIASWDQPDVGQREFPGFPIHFSRKVVTLTPAPPLGGHNLDVLTGVLGYSPEEVEKLLAAGVLADKPPL